MIIASVLSALLTALYAFTGGTLVAAVVAIASIIAANT